MTSGALYPVIMCGGSGTRLWPASRPDRPKQFLSLTGPQSLFQQAVRRAATIPAAQLPIVVGGVRHVGVIRRQLAEIGVDASILAEPLPRDSAPAIAAAAILIAERDPDGVAVVIASDHDIPEDAAFHRAVVTAAAAARRGLIVTLGVRPSAPATAYGYIRPALEGGPVPMVDAFVEKPDAGRAAEFVAAGYLWNSGNFIFAASTLLEELDRYSPGLVATVRVALAEARRDRPVVRLGPRFQQARKISIDYAVMERTGKAAVLPVDFAWSDLGAWDAVWAAAEKDTAGNAIAGPSVLVDAARECIVRNASDRTVAVIGAERLAVVVEPDAVLVCRLDSSQAVKAIAERVGAGQGAKPVEPDLADYAAQFSDWLRCAALPLWWALGADHANGGFHEFLTADCTAPACARRMRVQARQAWVFAEAAAMGWAGPWAQAADHGLAELDRNYRRGDGLYRTLVHANGSALDDTAFLYDQAFVLLARAARFRLGAPHPGHDPRPIELLETIEAAYAHPGGGFRETGDLFLSNPLMHLLEACLAWAERTDHARWERAAGDLVALACERLVDPVRGCIGGHYGADWSPLADATAELIEPGHQFEWAWLLQRWGRRHGDRRAKAAAAHLFAAGIAGIHPEHGAVVDQLEDGRTIASGRARLWPQAEYLKAALILSEPDPTSTDETRKEYERHARAAAAILWRYLQTPIRGLWYDKLQESGDFVAEPAPASSLYHLMAAVQQLAKTSLVQSET